MSDYLTITKNHSVSDVASVLLASFEDLRGNESRLFLACSGGIDSMVLLHLAASYAKKCGIALTVLHVNYGLRGPESDGDEVFVRDTCLKLGVPCEVLRPEANPKGQIGIQNWARQIRYEWFDKLAGEKDKILLAHHRDDLIETILMRIVRGSALSSLMGMKASEGKLLRPLLELRRSDIENLADQWSISFREDSSNAKLDYSRNRLRHRILPELEAMFPGAGQNLFELAKSGQEWADFFKNNMSRREEPCSPKDWQEFGFYPSSQLVLQKLERFLNKDFAANRPSRPWLEALYEALCGGAKTVFQLGSDFEARVFEGGVSFDRHSTAKFESPRWKQFQGELTKVGLASRLSPGARLDVDLDASGEMQDNNNVRTSPK